MKKLLVFHTKIGPYRVDFFNHLTKVFDTQICIDDKHVYESLATNIEKKYEFPFITFSSVNGLYKLFRFVFCQIKKFHPDVVMVSECGIVSFLVVIYRLFTNHKYRIVSIIDDSYDQIANNRYFSRRHKLAEHLLVPFFHQVITVEPRVANFFNQKYGKGICFPIIRDENKYRHNLEKILPQSWEYEERYHLKGKKIILYVGRFVKIKNIPLLIKVFNKLNDDSLSLVLVGAGEESQSIRSLCGNNIILTGPLSGDNLDAWYNIADIFVLPSFVELFGAVTNEALMAGCKCLVSNRAGSACLIEESINGFTFNPMDEEDLLGKIKLLLCQIPSEKKGVRPSLMPCFFDEEISKLINGLFSEK